MKIILYLVAVLVIAVLSPVSGQASAGGREAIRIAIVKGSDNVLISGEGLEASDDRGGPLALSYPVKIRREKIGVSVDGVSTGALSIASSGYIQVNGKGYRGTIEIVPGNRGLLVVNELPLEEYLIGLINCEISSKWPLEAVKAQAVVARTYALYQKEARKKQFYHLETDVIDQVYSGCDLEDSRSARAVEETMGEVLTYQGKVIQSFFHSICGGRTEASENVWSLKIPYLRGVTCKYCLTSPAVRWEQTIPKKKVESTLRAGGFARISGLRDVRPKSRYPSGRIELLEIVSAKGGTTIPAVTFRKLMGYGVIRSTAFEVTARESDLIFTGTGYGHGVGLCQWGAKQRAEEGFSYREILEYYYPDTRLYHQYDD